MKLSEIVLLRPILTEKALHLQEKHNQYGFAITRDANKIDVKRAVETKFNVSVIDVKTLVVKGKSKRMNTRRGMTFGRRSTWKKAIVTLKSGDSIDFFAGVGKA